MLDSFHNEMRGGTGHVFGWDGDLAHARQAAGPDRQAARAAAGGRSQVAVPAKEQQGARTGWRGRRLRLNGHGSCFHGDRKSTRLNSSHQIISYAVFCLKKKTNTSHANRTTSTAST